MKNLSLIVVMSFLMSACGGGIDGIPGLVPTPSAEGTPAPASNDAQGADKTRPADSEKDSGEFEDEADKDETPVAIVTPKPTPNPTPKPQPTPDDSIDDSPEPSYFVSTSHGVEFKVYLPTSFSKKKATRLAVFLHGDTANGYFENYFISLKNFALKNGMVFVAALSPNRDSWWHENSFADDLDNALGELQERLKFSKQDILWSGVSGGSTFLTMQFIPKVGMHYSGVVAATCGGAPTSLFKTSEIPTLKTKYELNFVYGDKDFLADPNGTYGPVIPKTMTQYSGFGFPVTKKVLPNTTHCAFDVNSEIIRIWTGAL